MRSCNDSCIGVAAIAEGGDGRVTLCVCLCPAQLYIKHACDTVKVDSNWGRVFYTNLWSSVPCPAATSCANLSRGDRRWLCLAVGPSSWTRPTDAPL